MDGEELTEQETALYDRQITVWGADAQRRGLICCDSLKEFNAMIRVSVEKDLEPFVYCFTFISGTNEVNMVSKGLKKQLSANYSIQVLRKVSKLYFAMRVIERFEEAEGRSVGEISIEDLPGVLS
ncbi:hypothetical protein QYF36_011305 [Acer negundo]|nr:hypothetical protein QYF36_011305 [Acer negundo]